MPNKLRLPFTLLTILFKAFKRFIVNVVVSVLQTQSNEEFLVWFSHPAQVFFFPLVFERREDGLVGGLHAGGAVEAADEPGVDAGRVEVVQARLGCNSIHFFGPESGRSYFWSCEIRLQRPPVIRYNVPRLNDWRQNVRFIRSH